MNRYLVFFLGVITGISVPILLYILLFGSFLIGGYGEMYDDGDYLSDTIVEVVEEAVEAINTDSIEVKGRNGYVNLSIGMSKEKVLEKLGRPKTTEINQETETWNYEYPDDGASGLSVEMIIKFDKKGLISINQY